MTSGLKNVLPYIRRNLTMDNYADLLSKISVNCKEFLSYMPLTEYNIFNVLNINEKEVVMCRFLADLLNPEGQHGCGILFLKSFLEEILKEYRMSDTILTCTEVKKEFVIDNGRRVDIVIRNNCFLIPIEVKIYADEQEGQCFDYYEIAKNAPIVYLTRFGDVPSEYSRKKKGGTDILSLDNIQCISWADDICDWLTKLLAQLNDPIKSIIMQYIDAIHIVADKREKKAMKKSLEVLFESTDYFRAGIQIEKSMKTAKLRLMRSMFDDFKEEMEGVTSKYGLELEKDAHYYSYDEKRHEKFYDCYSTYPGLNYVVKKAKFQKSSLQMWFRVEVEDKLFAGISLFDIEAIPEDGNLKGCQVNDITPQIIDEAVQYLNRDIINPWEWWFTRCYPNGKRQDAYYEDVPDFKNMNECVVSLVDNQKRKEYVKNAVKVFEEHILKYLMNV